MYRQSQMRLLSGKPNPRAVEAVGVVLPSLLTHPVMPEGQPESLQSFPPLTTSTGLTIGSNERAYS